MNKVLREIDFYKQHDHFFLEINSKMCSSLDVVFNLFRRHLKVEGKDNLFNDISNEIFEIDNAQFFRLDMNMNFIGWDYDGYKRSNCSSQEEWNETLIDFLDDVSGAHESNIKNIHLKKINLKIDYLFEDLFHSMKSFDSNSGVLANKYKIIFEDRLGYGNHIYISTDTLYIKNYIPDRKKSFEFKKKTLINNIKRNRTKFNIDKIINILKHDNLLVIEKPIYRYSGILFSINTSHTPKEILNLLNDGYKVFVYCVDEKDSNKLRTSVTKKV